MTTYSWDFSLPNPAFTRLIRRTNTVPTRNPLTGAFTVDVRAGSRWEYQLTWINLAEDARADLLGFMARLNGREHRVRLPMFNETNRGAWNGTPRVDGGSQTGSSLSCDGAVANTINYAKRGDYFRFDNCIRQVTADADANATGDFTLEFWPPIRTSPANNELLAFTDGVITGIYALMDDLDADNYGDVIGAGGAIVNRSSIALSFEDDVLA